MASKKQQATKAQEAFNADTDAVNGTSEPQSAPKAIRTEVIDGGLRFLFGTGTSQTIMLADLDPAIIEAATVHGLRQKVQDAAAISRNPVTGASATFEDKEAACRAVIDRLLSGHWNAPAGEREASGGMLFRALCELQPNADKVAIKAKIDGWTKEQVAAVRLNPKVKVILDRMAVERAPKVDSDALLAGL